MFRISQRAKEATDVLESNLDELVNDRASALGTKELGRVGADLGRHGLELSESAITEGV